MAKQKEIGKNIVLVPKDGFGQRVLIKNVVLWYHSHGSYTFVTIGPKNKTSRSFPSENIWEVKEDF